MLQLINLSIRTRCRVLQNTVKHVIIHFNGCALACKIAIIRLLSYQRNAIIHGYNIINDNYNRNAIVTPCGHSIHVDPDKI